MDILVCVKRVPMVGGTVLLTADGQDVDTRMSGFTVSPHEECAVEEAVQLAEREGGTVTVLTLGPPEAADQLRDMLALGADRGVLLESDGREWGPIATAAAIGRAIPGLRGAPFPLIFFGNEAADNRRLPGRHPRRARSWRAVRDRDQETGAFRTRLQAWRDHAGGQESFELDLPAVVGVREGINLPRYPSLPGRLRARRAEITVLRPAWQPDRLRKERLRVPEVARGRAEILGRGTGTDAVPALMRVLDGLGVLQ